MARSLRFGAGAAATLLCAAAIAQPPQTPPAPPTSPPSPPTASNPPPPEKSPAPQPTSEPSGPGYEVTEPVAMPFGPDVPTDIPEEITEGKAPRPNWLGITDATDPFKDVEDALKKLERETGLKLGFAYTMLFQQASAGPGDRYGGGGDIDLLAQWKLIDREGKNTGELNASFEYRFQIGSQTPSALGPSIGSLIPTSNGFSERPPIVKELYWNQRLFDGALRLVAGRIDMENYVGGQRMQSANTFFLNKAFSSNPAIAYPSIGLGAGGAVLPVEWLYISGGVSDANAKTTQAGFNTAFDTGQLFSFVEFGVLTDIPDLGKGRQRLALWHTDARPQAGKPSDQGISLTLDQDFGQDFTAFVRVANSQANLTNVEWLAEAGMGLKGVLGNDGDFTGLGIAYARPPAGRAETIVEAFHRFQLAYRTQFTIGVQGIFNPTNAPQDAALLVVEARLRFTF